MKRYLALLVALLLLAGLLCGCGNAPSSSDGLKIVTTIFPIYDWVMQILGDKSSDAEVKMLLDSGVDLHSYQPTADDIIRISNCDLFIYVGGESDEWVEAALDSSSNKNMVVINLIDVLGDAVRAEETVEGLQTAAEDPDETEVDEHIWLSLRNAQVCCAEIARVLNDIDPDNAPVYSSNVNGFMDELKALDGEYTAAVEAAKGKTLLFADRFPFRYLTEDYGLTYYAAFSGCSAESEASFETLTFLASKLRECVLSDVIILEGSDSSIAESVITASGVGAGLLTMDSMQSVTAKDVENGVSYLCIMEKNLDALKAALG